MACFWEPPADHPFFLHPDCADEIVSTAKQKLESGDFGLMFKEKPDLIRAELAGLAAIAAKLTGKQEQDANSAATALFEPAALEYLVDRSANRYWFWYLLSKLRTNRMPVNLAAAARAHARAKDSLYDNRYGFAFITPSSLEHQLKALPPGFLCEMWHKGRVICDNSGGEYRTSINPILLED